MTSQLSIDTPISYIVPGLEPMKARMSMMWSSDDPMALRMVFHQDEDDVAWTVSRDVFVECLLAPPGPTFGKGDMLLERGVVSFNMILDGADNGTASVTFFCQPVAEMLKKSLMIVPRGEQETEAFEAGLDSFLDEVLSQ